jgi:hypothetical protein
MKNPTKKIRTTIDNLPEHGATTRKELSNNQLRLVTGGLLPVGAEPSCCTMCGDVDCD